MGSDKYKYYTESIEINPNDNKPMQNIAAPAGISYGYVAGFNSATSLKGYYKDWITASGANEGALALPTAVEGFPTLASAVTAFAAPAWAGANPTWLAVPIARAGFRTFSAHLTNGMPQDLNVSAWLVPEVNDKNGFAGTNLATAEGLFATPIIQDEILVKTNGGTLVFGPGGRELTAGSMAPAGVLLIKFSKTTTPASGNIRVGIARQR